MNDFTQNISERITEKGGHIISGLALGIDSYAHLGALKKEQLQLYLVVE